MFGVAPGAANNEEDCMPDLTTFITNHVPLFLIACVVIVILFIVEGLRAKRGSFNINPLQTTQLINHQNAIIIDTRDAEAYKNGHIIDAIRMPSDEIKQLNKKMEKLKGKKL